MVKAVNIAAPGFLVVLLAAASFDRPVRGPFIAYVVNQLSGTVTAFNTRTRMVFRADQGGQQSQPQAAG